MNRGEVDGIFAIGLWAGPPRRHLRIPPFPSGARYTAEALVAVGINRQEHGHRLRVRRLGIDTQQEAIIWKAALSTLSLACRS
jgi:hypothetical protein